VVKKKKKFKRSGHRYPAGLCAYMLFVKADSGFLKGKQNGKAKTLARTKGKCFPAVSTARSPVTTARFA